MIRRILLPVLIILLNCMSARADEDVVVDNSKQFIEIEVHALVGCSYMTENYVSCYPAISDLNTMAGVSFGAGVGAQFNLTRLIGLGTEFNLMRNAFKMDMAVVGPQSVSNVFQRNTYYKIDFPVYMRFMFGLATNVKWNVDGGLYYTYGLGGKQKNNIYDTRSNDLGQLMLSMTSLDADFYKDSNAFINSYDRSDIGLHLATGLTFRKHLSIGVRAHFGFKDVSHSVGIVKPDMHTMDFRACVGWKF